MTTTVWPIDAVSGAPNYTGRMARQVAGALLGGKTAARPLGGLSGLIAGSGNPVSASPTTWTVGQCVGVIDGEASTAAGPYFFSNDLNVTGAMTAADGTNGRIDIISAQLSDPAEGDGSSVPGVAFVYTTGVASGSPVAPAVPARAVLIAQINVPRSGTGSPSIIDTATPRVVAAGGAQPCASSTTYPSSPYFGQAVYDLALKQQLNWNGTIWAAPQGDTGWMNIAPLSGFTSNAAQVRIQGTRVTGRGSITRNAGAFPAAGTGCGTLPAGSAPGAEFRASTPAFASSTPDSMGVLIGAGSLTIQGFSIGAGIDTVYLSCLNYYTD